MSLELENINAARRHLLARTGAIAAAVASALVVPRSAGAAPSPRLCWDNDDLDALHSEFGHLRVVRYEDKGQRLAAPILIASAADRAAIDLRGKDPTIRIGSGTRRLLLGSRGVSFKDGQREEAWSKRSVGKLLELLRRDESMRGDLIGLRLAIHALYPEYLARSKASAPKQFMEQRRKSAKSTNSFGRRSGATCTTTSAVETVTTTITHAEDVILSAAEQFERCTQLCYDQFLKGDKDDYLGYGLCEAGCIASGFIDLVVGTIEVVETLVEEVVRTVVTCTRDIIKGRFPNPLRDLPVPEWLGAAGFSGAVPAAAPAFPADVTAKAIDILTKMVKSLPGAIRCVVEGSWSITDLGDLHVDIAGVESVPVGVTVCMNRECAMKLTGAGFGADAFAIVSGLISLATSGGVATAVAAAGVTGAAAAVLTQAILVFLAVLIVLMIHLIIVAGQIVAYDALGMIDGGICITHPSMPVAVATVVNPVLGLVALANIPLIVTPR